MYVPNVSTQTDFKVKYTWYLNNVYFLDLLLPGKADERINRSRRNLSKSVWAEKAKEYEKLYVCSLIMALKQIPDPLSYILPVRTDSG